MNVHATAAVDLCACFPQIPHELLQGSDVAVVENRCYKLHPVVSSGDPSPFPLRTDAAVSHDRPLASAGVFYDALVVPSPLIQGWRSEESGDHLRRLLSRDARELELAPEG